MKTKITVIFLSVFLMGAFILFGTVSAVHAEDVIPTPEVTPTDEIPPAPTESTPAESPTPEPIASPTSEPELSGTLAEGEVEMMAMSSPMMLGATVTKPVWFNTSVGIKEYDTFTQAFDDIDFGLFPSDGIIHVEDFYAGGETDSVLSLYYDTGKLYSSTSIKGIVGPSLNPDTNSPMVTISTPLEFMNFTGGFTISNICVDTTRIGPDYGAITLSNMSGTQTLKNLVVTNHDSTSSGIFVKTASGSIVLMNVDSSENPGGGAILQTGTSGSISVTNSSFDGNGGVTLLDGTKVAGLMVDTTSSNSSVTLNGVSTSGNTSPDAPGVLIKKSGTLTIKNSMFNNNLGGGLANLFDPLDPRVTIQGATVLDNVTASDNHSVDLVHGGSGIELHTNGAITANNIFATGNLNYGMKLDNCNFAGAACTSTSTGVVIITNSEFSSNIEKSGLEITSRGSVTLKKVAASENLHSSANGVKIDNTYGTSGVTISGTVAGDNQFIHNGSHGLQIDSKGNISINFVTSEGNTGDGAWLVNKLGKGTVAIANSKFYNNTSSGLSIESKNNVTILNVLSSENDGGSGVKIDNKIDTSGLGFGSVTVTNLTVIKNSDWGLNVLSNGTITGTGIAASENPMGGANLNNQDATLPKNVSLNKSTFNNNRSGGELGPGLVVLSKGAITLTGVGANKNGLGGIILENPTSLGAVVINNSLNPVLYSISENGEEGVVITTKGAVTLTGVYADANQFGAVINNYFFGRTASVTISASHFNANTVGDGLYVNSGGKITLTKTSASGNEGIGAQLLNDQAGSTIQSITINNDALKIGSELNGFSDNKNGGLVIGARGPVNLSNVEASRNTGNGGLINNSAGGPADLKITNSYFDFNKDDGTGGGYGLSIESMGNITLNGGSASGNYVFGAKLDNQRGGAFPIKNITINRFSFNENGTGFGLEAHANGTITITSVKTEGNATFGAHLDNRLEDPLLKDSGLGVVVKTSSFSSNDAGIGLEILTAGSVLMDGVTANGNTGGEGIKVTSTPILLSVKPVTLNRSSANGNSLDGLKVDAVGLITLNGVIANGNTLSGAVLDNSTATTTNKPGITILATLGANNFNGNRQGLTINSRGPVALTSVAANFNTHNSGIYINNNNCSGVCPKSNISLNKVNTRGNYGDGVYIFESNGASITLTGLTSLSNGGSGVFLHSLYELAKISILSGLFMGNSGYGIDVDRTGSNYPILTGTSYFGNETGNLYIH